MTDEREESVYGLFILLFFFFFFQVNENEIIRPDRETINNKKYMNRDFCFVCCTVHITSIHLTVRNKV